MTLFINAETLSHAGPQITSAVADRARASRVCACRACSSSRFTSSLHN
jgi:hypothetical protein